MEYPKIALKSDGTVETGEIIITYLKSLGTSNPNNYKGYGAGYYFINHCGEIDTELYFPEDYTLVTLEQKQKLFKLI